MARQLEFDRTEVLRRAMRVFWRKGFAATSTDDLLGEMGVGRQSMYNTFGDKRSLYLEALQSYQDTAVEGHLARLASSDSPLEGIRALLGGLAVDDDTVRALGCLGVGAVGEFGDRDDDVRQITARANQAVADAVAVRIIEGEARGEIDDSVDTRAAVEFVLMTMTGLQLAARGGSDAASMRRAADFVVDRLSKR